MTRTVKLQVISMSNNIEYDKLCREKFEMMNEVRVIKNRTVQYLWAAKHDVSPIITKKSNAKTLQGKSGAYASESSLNSYSYNISVASQDAYKHFTNKEYQRGVFVGTNSIPSYKKNQPINIGGQSMVLTNEGNEWLISIDLFSRKRSKELELPNGKIMYKLVVKDKSSRVILERITNGEYKLTASKLSYDNRKKKWMLALGYSSLNPKLEIDLDPNKIMGIDLGIVYPAYMSFNHCLARYWIDGGEIESFRKQTERRRDSMKRQRRYCGEGSIGHGRKTRMKPVLDIGDKIARFRDTANHRYSKYIVEMAVRHGCGTIQIEDLVGISKDNLFIKNWTYFDLQQKVEYKAKTVGIQVVKVNPKYTSQRCSKCGEIDPANRIEQSKFHCVSCGFSANADYNASQNIATHNIEQIIKDYVTNENVA